MSGEPPFLPDRDPVGELVTPFVSDAELEQKAERYSRLHGTDDEPERSPGLVARIVRRVRDALKR